MINLNLIEHRIGADDGSITQTESRRALLERALRDLGCSRGGLTTPAMTVTDPANPDRHHPWHQPFSPFDLEDLAQMIQTACYVVVAALSGLRRSELAEMRRGCVRAEQLANGKLRYRIHAKLIKGKPFGGEDERWTVIEEVAQAFSVVEQLSDRDQPFARFHPSARYAKLVRWTNSLGAEAFLVPIPDWQISCRQFRRTLARLLGFRPHGVIAGKVHLKHVSVVTSEGYYGRAGSSAAAFLAEVEQETARARLETTKRLYGDWAAGGQPMTGPGRADRAVQGGSRQDCAVRGQRRRFRPPSRGVAPPPSQHPARRAAQQLLVRRPGQGPLPKTGRTDRRIGPAHRDVRTDPLRQLHQPSRTRARMD